MNTYTYTFISYGFGGRTAAGTKTVRCCVRPCPGPRKQSHVFADPAGAGPAPGRAGGAIICAFAGLGWPMGSNMSFAVGPVISWGWGSVIA